MFELVPHGWFSWGFSVLENDSSVATIDISSWWEKGTLVVSGSTYQVNREGLMTGRFILESNGTPLADAKKPSALRRVFTVRHGGRTYTLKAQSAFGRTFMLLEHDRQVGSISPSGIFTRRATVILPDELPLPMKVFLVWLAVVLWKRDWDAATVANS